MADAGNMEIPKSSFSTPSANSREFGLSDSKSIYCFLKYPYFVLKNKI